MRTASIVTVVTLSLMAISSAYADERMGGRFFLEPEVGYGLAGSLKTSGSLADSYSGVDVGGRLGVNLGRVFMLGGSFEYMPSITYTPNGGTALTTKPNLMEGGAFAGFEFSRFRIWGGYNFLDSMGNFSGVTLKGSSFFGGLGYRIFSKVSLNAQAFFQTYTKATVGGVSDALAANETGSHYLLSLSIPLRF